MSHSPGKKIFLVKNCKAWFFLLKFETLHPDDYVYLIWSLNGWLHCSMKSERATLDWRLGADRWSNKVSSLSELENLKGCAAHEYQLLALRFVTFLLEDPLFHRQTFFIKLVSYSQAYLFKLGVFEDCFLHLIKMDKACKWKYD